MVDEIVEAFEAGRTLALTNMLATLCDALGVASQQLAKTESAHAGRMADIQKAAELTERFAGWKAFS
jgi:protein-disulfide isomerase-like protein with CxxC motif